MEGSGSPGPGQEEKLAESAGEVPQSDDEEEGGVWAVVLGTI